MPWALVIVLFPAVTFFEFGYWRVELISLHVFTPAISGVLSATTTYLLLDALVRMRLVPALGDVRLSRVSGTRTLGIASRLAMLVFVVGFAPFFTLLGQIDAADRRLEAGVPFADVFAALLGGASWVTVMFLILGCFFTALFAYTLTRPLRRTAAGLGRVQEGDLRSRVPVDSK